MDTTPQRAKHAAPKVHGRRRAPDPASDPVNIAPLTQTIPVVQAGERRQALQLERELVVQATTDTHQPRHSAVAVAATTGLIMLSAMSGTIANATIDAEAAGKEPGTETSAIPVVESPDIVGADIKADEHQAILHDRVEVQTEAEPPPPPVVEEVVAEPEPVPFAEPAPPAPPAVPEQYFNRETGQYILNGYAYEIPSVPPPPSSVAPVASKNVAILSAALGQVGVWQDCTMLVTNSLAAVGIYFHDWPAGYMTLGTIITADQAQPGDILYYMDGGAGVPHVAIYAGNGQAVHGGWNGNQTVVFDANVGSGPVFIRVH